MTFISHHHRNCFVFKACRLRPLWLLLMMNATIVHAQTCPDTPVTGTEKPSGGASHIDFSKIPIEFSFDGGSSVLNGESQLQGGTATQGSRSISADILHYDFATQKVKADGNVAYDDAQLHLAGSDANLDTNAGVEFDQASFMLKTRVGRGSADRIQLTPQGNLKLKTVKYTSCPISKPDWELKLSELDIDQAARTGTGRNVSLDFKGIPLFYTPWISFPVGDERKSGFLFPSFSSSSRGGYSLLVPWYWNIAPNYDATFTPVIDSVRGAELNTEFRYLSELNKSMLQGNYLPNDPTQHDWRGWLELKHQTDFNPYLRLQLNGAAVSDHQWFEDFGQNRDETSQVYLPQKLELSAYSANWFGSAVIQHLQILDTGIVTSQPPASNARPYTAAPQITVAGHEQLPFGLDFNFNGELSYFIRNDHTYTAVEDPASNTTIYVAHNNANVNGARLYAAPELSLPLRTSGMYVIPSTSWRYTAYQLSPNTVYEQDFEAQHGVNLNRGPTLSAPVSSLDMGMVFERLSPGGQRLYTLQPRILYVNVPYRPQADLPIFDTTLPDFNLVQLFRVDRFVGPDRIGDTNQISTGITTRMLDAHSGRQFLSGTLGQIFYLKAPCITTLDLPDTCHTNAATHSSPVIGQIALSTYKNWTTSIGIQWDPVKSHTERSEMNFQYLPAENKVINLSYRFARSIGVVATTIMPNDTADERVDQWESSFAWPIGVNWSTYGRVVYSRLDNALHDYLGGIEYRSCCWNLRLVYGRSITTRNGTYDTRFGLQFELKGLGSAGTADTSLQNAIPGYTVRHK